jgi:predicted ATPase
MAKISSRTPVGPPRIDYIRVENYRALRKVELADLTPLTVLLGPNGSGKSSVFDVFNFLSECFTLGLRKAWDKRGRFRELRTRGSDGHILFELRYRETPQSQPATYHLEIDESPQARWSSRSRSSGGVSPRGPAHPTRS